MFVEKKTPGAVAGLNQRVHLGADGAGVIGPDVQPRAGGKTRAGDLIPGLRGSRAALNLPAAESHGLGVGGRRGCSERAHREQGRREQGQAAARHS
jgi:hypothetical protein